MKLLTTDYPSPGTVNHYRIDSEQRRWVEEYQGKVGLMDLKAMVAAMASDPCWSANLHGLIDFSDVELDLSANDILRLALVLKHEEHRTRGWLVYVANNSTVFGIVRMLSYWSRNSERLRIFNTREEAETWLEHNMDQTPPNFREVESSEAAAALRNVI
ncbi:MAG: hypothetical protein ABI600_20790 [Luteolibacter sp.]